MKKSSKAFFIEAKAIEDYSFFQLIHGWLYLRFPYLYISIGKGDHPAGKILRKIIAAVSRIFPKKDKTHDEEQVNARANAYHGKVVTLESASELVSIEKDISLKNLEQIIPFDHAKDIILKNPDHIAVIDCPCRKGKETYCEPLDVCLIVGEPFVCFFLEHHPQSSRRIDVAEAREILRQENKRGHVHHAYFKDVVLNRFYAICNCCECCCGAMQAQRSGTPMIISSGFIAEVKKGACIACGICEEICQFRAVQVDSIAKVDPAACMGCGVCVNHCPSEAIELTRDLSKPAPLEISELISQ